MKRIEQKEEELVTVLRVERRSKSRAELSCEEIMRLARKRGKAAQGAQVVEPLPGGALPATTGKK